MVLLISGTRGLNVGSFSPSASDADHPTTASEGGYDLAAEGSGTRVTIHNVLEGHGPGKLIAPLALRQARKGADDFGRSVKAAVEAS